MPGQTDLIAQVLIKVDGADLPTKLMDALIAAEVHDSLHLPDMFTLHLRDPELEALETQTFALGKSVEISLQGEAATAKLMKGEITAIEPELSQSGGPTIIVRGYDRSHRLHRQRKSRSFLQTKDSDIARTVAQEGGLRPQVAATRQVFDYVLQQNQTDWEFLWQRARRIGYRVFIEDDVLHFEPAPQSPPEALTLRWSENLMEFRASLTTAEQVEDVIVRGWDPQAKREIIGRATRPQGTPQIGEGRTGAEATSRAFGRAGRHVVVDRPVASQAEADALAQALCDELGHAYIEAEGVSFGDPRVVAGANVRLAGLGRRFAGTYVVTDAVHRYDASGYTTSFTISGARSLTMASLLAPVTRSPGGNGSGIAIGIVTNNRDPDGQGRVKVRFPWLADQEESTWARLAAPMAGAERGFLFLPEVNDEVLIAFEHGDIHRPYVLGALWNGQDRPPVPNDKAVSSTGRVNQRIIKTRAGHTIILDDSDGGGGITIVDRTGQNSLSIDSGNNSMKIEVQGNLELKAQGKVKITGQAGVEIEGTPGKVSVKGTRIDLN
ncbi:MAG TPA: VgrG-related protein [Dehalococcoidia bacterium]|nr:VgrG-related protein [Dehalococcoidia bacterium]